MGLRGPAPCTDPQVLHERRLRRRQVQREYYARNRVAILARRSVMAPAWDRRYRELNADKVRAEARARYYENRDREIARVTERQRDTRAFLEQVKGTVCLECDGIFEPGGLLFHHRDPSTKSFTIGDAKSYSRQTLITEIAKCDVICRACHTRLHFT